MSDNSTKQMIEVYVERAPAPMFLSGFFRSPPKNFHTSEAIELDVKRDGEDVAIAIEDLTTGQRLVDDSIYSNKVLVPPIFDIESPISAYSQIKRQAGQDPFESPDFNANAMREAFVKFDKAQDMIRRAVELMSSQVLQTNVVTLVNKDGAAIYSIDFKKKTELFPTVGTTWAEDGTAGTPIKDLEDLAAAVRTYGLVDPNKLIFGRTALRRFYNNQTVQKYLEKNGLGLGQLVPAVRGKGGTFHGRVSIGAYLFEIWSYTGGYRHPQTGVRTDYVDPEKVIMLSDETRLDLSFGAIPRFANPAQPALPFMPQRFTDSAKGIALSTYAYISPDGKHLVVSAGTRPLTIPTAVDAFGCLKMTT